MRITKKGQLTIPKELRDRHGITPTTDLDVLATEDGLLIVKVAKLHFGRFRGRANAKGLPRRTDVFLNLIREGHARRGR